VATVGLWGIKPEHCKIRNRKTKLSAWALCRLKHVL
jgi:hypothetical protein